MQFVDQQQAQSDQSDREFGQPLRNVPCTYSSWMILPPGRDGASIRHRSLGEGSNGTLSVRTERLHGQWRDFLHDICNAVRHLRCRRCRPVHAHPRQRLFSFPAEIGAASGLIRSARVLIAIRSLSSRPVSADRTSSIFDGRQSGWTRRTHPPKRVALRVRHVKAAAMPTIPLQLRS